MGIGAAVAKALDQGVIVPSVARGRDAFQATCANIGPYSNAYSCDRTGADAITAMMELNTSLRPHLSLSIFAASQQQGWG